MLIKSNELKNLNILKAVLLFVSLIVLILYIVYMYNINFFRLTRPCMMTAITEFICVFTCFISAYYLALSRIKETASFSKSLIQI